MLEAFEDRRKANKYLQRSTYELIGKANEILKSYAERGYTVTLRQLFYQFVKRNWLPNSEHSYDRLGVALSSGRLFGLVDWSAMEDRVRFLNAYDVFVFNNSGKFMNDAPNRYFEHVRADQPIYIEIGIEKDAVVNIVERPCNKWRIPYIAWRGYGSQTELYNAGKRIEAKYNEGYEVVILHLGDHDPSGQDMTRDLESRMQMLSHYTPFRFERLALNMDQIKKYDPPPNPAKQSDSRYAEYVHNYGRSCWELDALDPEVIDALVSDAIERLTDIELFEAAKLREEESRNEIRDVAANWQAALNVRNTDNGDYAW